MRLRILALAALGIGGCSSDQAQSQPVPVSPGTVTFRLLLPSTRSFCDQVVCAEPTHFQFSTPSGELFARGAPICSTLCSTTGCVPGACPGLCPPGPGTGFDVTSPLETSWDGSYFELSTCGNNMGCFRKKFVAPGPYIARMCATPGTLAPIIDGAACTASGPVECVDVPFDLPGPSPIEASLPP